MQENKLAVGAGRAVPTRSTLAYVAAGTYTYSLTQAIRHLIGDTDNSTDLTVTLPPVAEAVGQIYSVVLKTDGGNDIVITDAGDDALFTDITLNDAKDFAVVMSNGVYWFYFNKAEVQ